MKNIILLHCQGNCVVWLNFETRIYLQTRNNTYMHQLLKSYHILARIWKVILQYCWMTDNCWHTSCAFLPFCSVLFMVCQQEYNQPSLYPHIATAWLWNSMLNPPHIVYTYIVKVFAINNFVNKNLQISIMQMQCIHHLHTNKFMNLCLHG